MARPTIHRRSDDRSEELLARFRSELSARLAERSDPLMAPRHLRRLLALLTDRADTVHDNERRHSAITEAAVALKLLARGCTLSVEVPTRNNRTADFDVRVGDTRFLLHVKRWTASLDRSDATLRIPTGLRALERVRRPYLVGSRWPASRALLARFVAQGEQFLQQASVGDEWVFRDDRDLPSGGLRILAPWPGDRAVLTVGLDAATNGDIGRLLRLLRKAYAQFDPRLANVIILCGGTRDDARLIDTTLLGSHVERWDLFPPRGHRVAHGRADDGFWAGERFALSRAVAWCPWSETRGLGATRMWFRSRGDANTVMREALGA